MASPSPTSKDIANAWANFYMQYRKMIGGANEPRSIIEAARKEWLAILNKLRNGNLRHWPTEPDEIRQIKELLDWKQCDMWYAIDGTDRINTRQITSHSPYTSFQDWALEVKGRWDPRKGVGANTRLSKIKPHGLKPKPDGSEHLFYPFLVPFAPLHGEPNGSLDSEEQKHFEVMKSVDRHCEFYSMAHEYTANMQKELEEVTDGAGRRELYQRYASSLLILATKSYGEWTKDVLDWKAPTNEDEVSDDNGSEDDDEDDEEEDDDDDDDEGETNTHPKSLPEIDKITEIRSNVFQEVAPSLYSTNTNNKGIDENDSKRAKANLNPEHIATPSNVASDNINRLLFQRLTIRDRQPEVSKTRPGQGVQSDPGGDLWPPGVYRAVYLPPTQSINSTATFQSRGQQEPSTSYPQRSNGVRKQSRGSVGIDTNIGPRKVGLESPFGSLHTSRSTMDAESLSSKENIHPTRGYPDQERKGLAFSSTFPGDNSIRRAGPVPSLPVTARGGHRVGSFPPVSPIFPRVSPMKQPSRSYPQSTHTFYSPLPRQTILHRGENIESWSTDDEMRLRLKLMEEGRAGYDSQDFVQNEEKRVDESSNPIAVKHISKANSKESPPTAHNPFMDDDTGELLASHLQSDFELQQTMAKFGLLGDVKPTLLPMQTWSPSSRLMEPPPPPPVAPTPSPWMSAAAVPSTPTPGVTSRWTRETSVMSTSTPQPAVPSTSSSSSFRNPFGMVAHSEPSPPPAPPSTMPSMMSAKAKGKQAMTANVNAAPEPQPIWGQPHKKASRPIVAEVVVTAAFPEPQPIWGQPHKRASPPIPAAIDVPIAAIPTIPPQVKKPTTPAPAPATAVASNKLTKKERQATAKKSGAAASRATSSSVVEEPESTPVVPLQVSSYPQPAEDPSVTEPATAEASLFSPSISQMLRFSSWDAANGDSVSTPGQASKVPSHFQQQQESFLAASEGLTPRQNPKKTPNQNPLKLSGVPLNKTAMEQLAAARGSATIRAPRNSLSAANANVPAPATKSLWNMFSSVPTSVAKPAQPVVGADPWIPGGFDGGAEGASGGGWGNDGGGSSGEVEETRQSFWQLQKPTNSKAAQSSSASVAAQSLRRMSEVPSPSPAPTPPARVTKLVTFVLPQAMGVPSPSAAANKKGKGQKGKGKKVTIEEVPEDEDKNIEHLPVDSKVILEGPDFSSNHHHHHLEHLESIVNPTIQILKRKPVAGEKLF